LAVLLLLGLSNALFVRSLASGGDPSLFGLRRFAEAEIGIGISVLFVAASLASQPPAIDQMLNRADVATIAEISDRVMPSWPRLISPSSDSLTKPGMDPTAASEALDKAWSEFNHNWAGIFVCVIALLAMVERSGKASWARHWPLIFLVMAGVLVVRSDPESWPLGPIGFFEVMKDPEVFQHRAVILLLVPFGLFEWAVRTGRLKKPWAAQCFPVLCAVGGLLLLAHSHTLTDVKQRFLIEISHLPMGAFGVLAGWARWLEIRSHGRIATVASWVWPLSFLMVGLLLLEYRES